MEESNKILTLGVKLEDIKEVKEDLKEIKDLIDVIGDKVKNIGITSLGVIKLKEKDILTIKSEYRMSKDMSEDICSLLKSKLPGIEVLYLDRGLTIEGYRIESNM